MISWISVENKEQNMFIRELIRALRVSRGKVNAFSLSFSYVHPLLHPRKRSVRQQMKTCRPRPSDRWARFRERLLFLRRFRNRFRSRGGLPIALPTTRISGGLSAHPRSDAAVVVSPLPFLCRNKNKRNCAIWVEKRGNGFATSARGCVFIPVG